MPDRSTRRYWKAPARCSVSTEPPGSRWPACARSTNCARTPPSASAAGRVRKHRAAVRRPPRLPLPGPDKSDRPSDSPIRAGSSARRRHPPSGQSARRFAPTATPAGAHDDPASAGPAPAISARNPPAAAVRAARTVAAGWAVRSPPIRGTGSRSSKSVAPTRPAIGQPLPPLDRCPRSAHRSHGERRPRAKPWPPTPATGVPVSQGRQLRPSARERPAARMAKTTRQNPPCRAATRSKPARWIRRRFPCPARKPHPAAAPALRSRLRTKGSRRRSCAHPARDPPAVRRCGCGRPTRSSTPHIAARIPRHASRPRSWSLAAGSAIWIRRYSAPRGSASPASNDDPATFTT